ncbi:MAG: DUF58 domain-containing protein [Chthoniobacterales bacterium]
MTTATVDELFDTEFLRRLDSLTLAARQLVKGRQRAQRRASTHGASVEFAEYRPFTDGDDWRYIDWNAFARWRQLVLKLFIEEEDWHIHLLIDNSRSMSLGTKYDYARQTAGGLAYLGLANLDRVSAVPLQQNAAHRWPPTRGKDRFMLFLRYLAALPVMDEVKSLEEHVRTWLSGKPRRGLTVLLSDLWGRDLEDAFRALDRLRYSRQEIAIIQIADPSESEAGNPGEYLLEDCEEGLSRLTLIDSKSASAYRENYKNYQNALRSYCRRYQIALIQTDTSLPVGDLLLHTLQQGGFVE